MDREEGKVRYDHPRGGHGFLSVRDELVYPPGSIRPVPAGRCPRCETPAGEWEPPVHDARYMNRIATIRETQGARSDAEAHTRYLVETGGFIHTCEQCRTSFFVPAYAARIKGV